MFVWSDWCGNGEREPPACRSSREYAPPRQSHATSRCRLRSEPAHMRVLTHVNALPAQMHEMEARDELQALQALPSASSASDRPYAGEAGRSSDTTSSPHVTGSI